MYHYYAKLVRVVDGDTVVLDVDLGFYITVRETFRLAGINAPERFTDEGKAASAWLETELNRGELTFHSQKGHGPHQEKYGRWLATIYVGDEEISVNKKMIIEGHAVEYMPEKD